MINPKILRQLREARQWTQADLQEKSRVDKQTISMIERGQRTQVRAHTVQALSKALGVDPDVLSGQTPIGEVRFDHRSTLSVRIDDGPRNALTLAAMRYGVPVSAVVELAPFLFTWAAEASLGRRTERVRAFRELESQLDAMQELFPHLDNRLTSSSDTEDIIFREEDSIKARDIFAWRMEGDFDRPGRSLDFDEHDGPIVHFLRVLAEQISPLAEFESWHPEGGPDFVVCKEEAIDLMGGDCDLADDIIGGNIPLHNMPKELAGKDRLLDRVAWARAEAAKAASQLLEV